MKSEILTLLSFYCLIDPPLVEFAHLTLSTRTGKPQPRIFTAEEIDRLLEREGLAKPKDEEELVAGAGATDGTSAQAAGSMSGTTGAPSGAGSGTGSGGQAGSGGEGMNLD
jgi:hypothetical protein